MLFHLLFLQLVESRLKCGDWAVFLGAGGGVGHMGVQLAKAMGFRVIGIDGGDEKHQLCEKLGCEAFIDFTKVEDVATEVMRITGRGAHGVFVTAGSPAAYMSAPGMLGIGGKLMCIGLRAPSLLLHYLPLTSA
jgi:alcohol dehydrogenase, propanol-preferring